MALLVNPTNPNAATQTRDLQAAARRLGLTLHVLQAASERDFEAVFANWPGSRPARWWWVLMGCSFAAARSSAPWPSATAFPLSSKIAPLPRGRSTSHGASIPDGYRVVGVYAGRLLKGEKAADLPVQQATKVELVINRKTAKALGITVPPRCSAVPTR